MFFCCHKNHSRQKTSHRYGNDVLKKGLRLYREIQLFFCHSLQTQKTVKLNILHQRIAVYRIHRSICCHKYQNTGHRSNHTIRCALFLFISRVYHYFRFPFWKNSTPFFCKILSCQFSAFRIHINYACSRSFVFCKCLSGQINTCIFCFGITVADAGNHISYTGNNYLASYRYFFYVSAVIFVYRNLIFLFRPRSLCKYCET